MHKKPNIIPISIGAVVVIIIVIGLVFGGKSSKEKTPIVENIQPPVSQVLPDQNQNVNVDTSTNTNVNTNTSTSTNPTKVASKPTSIPASATDTIINTDAKKIDAELKALTTDSADTTPLSDNQ